MFDDQAFHDHAASPRGYGDVPDGAHLGVAGGSACGDMLCIGIRAESGLITSAGFEATACPATLAAAGAVVDAIDGAPLLSAARISERAIDDMLGGLRPQLRHAARLACDALHRAIGAAAADERVELAEANPRRRLVAMSGGVDSAVAALTQIEAGHEVVGVTLQLWDDPATNGEASCCSPQAVAQARTLAHELGAAHITLDLRRPFADGVIEPYLQAHREGRTPNPCVGCNGHVRFDALDGLRARAGATYVVTGHYARIERDEQGPLLVAADDDRKDQTYMLAAVGPDLLERLEFPLGRLRKTRVREIARAAGLTVADKPDSQDLCFIAGIGRDDFLVRHAGLDGRPGPIVDRNGVLLGTHEGAHRFTVGQRRGLGVAGPEPFYVLDVDAAANTVVVGTRPELATSDVHLAGARLLRDGDQVTHVKLRYRNDPLPCRVDPATRAGVHQRLHVALDEPVDGAAPGQIACLLRGSAVVGWATIVRDPNRKAGTQLRETVATR
jgi:tRNA-specific 2-thiouridylase